MSDDVNVAGVLDQVDAVDAKPLTDDDRTLVNHIESLPIIEQEVAELRRIALAQGQRLALQENMLREQQTRYEALVQQHSALLKQKNLHDMLKAKAVDFCRMVSARELGASTVSMSFHFTSSKIYKAEGTLEYRASIGYDSDTRGCNLDEVIMEACHRYARNRAQEPKLLTCDPAYEDKTKEENN